MDRRVFLTGAVGSLAATLAGCLRRRSGADEKPTERDEGAPGADCTGRPETGDDDSRFLESNETPESAGARELLRTVRERTDGLARFTDADGTERVGFSERGDTWEIRYRGAPHAGADRFREEIAELSTTFASNRPDGVSVVATSLHECTTGRWHVCAETAAAYERGDLDRETFVDEVRESAEVVNDC